MQAEHEIYDKDDDVLNRNDFAYRLSQRIIKYNSEKSFTIGVMGSWGSGKSSLINLTENYLKKEDIIIIRFNPWFFSNQRNLYLQFFKLIISTLKTKEREENLFESMITPKMRLFKRPENLLKEYFNYIEDSTLDVNVFEYSDELESYDSLKYHKEKCKTYINDFGCKIIVILDDIDRLTNSEIAQVFTLVKSLADFDNFIYILSFDKLIITKALKNINSEYKDDFIDKIINIPINVPKISKSKMDELILSNISPIYNEQLKNNANEYPNDFSEISSYLQLFIKDIRDLKRYMNILNFYMDYFNDELNINDYFLILAIQLFEYELFVKINNNQDALKIDMDFSVGDEPNEVIGLIEEFLNDIKKYWEKYREVLIFLFPFLDNKNWPITYKSQEKWYKEHRICNEHYFDKYFTLSLETNEASDFVVKKLIKMDDVDEICGILTKRSDLNYNHSLISKLSNSINEIPNNNHEAFIQSFMKCGDEIKLYHSSRKYIPQIFNKLIEKIPIENHFKLIKEGIDYPNNVFTISEFVYNYNYNDDFEKIKNLTIEKIRKSSENKDFINMAFLQDMLFYWKHLDDENYVKKYVLMNIKTDDEIISFLKKFRTKSESPFYIIGGGSEANLVLDLTELNTYHGLETYEKVVNNIINKQNISEDDKEICEIFLKQYEEYKIRENILR